MINQTKIRTVVLSLLMASCVIAGSATKAFAQNADEPQGLIPAQNTITITANKGATDETHPPLRLTPDKSEIVNVDEDVERVIIGNDTHVNIFLDSSRRLIAVPRLPGATHFTLMGKDGKIIMQRHVIVASPKQNYVRIRRSCGLSEGNCAPTQVYYCPGMCHEIGLSDGSSSAQNSMSISFPADMFGPLGGPDTAGGPATTTSMDEE